MAESHPNRENAPRRAGRVETATALGALFRAERRRRGLTLQDVRDATGLSMRFLSEFERGKENASVGRVLRALSSLGLDVLVLPRAMSARAMRAVRTELEADDPE